MVKTRRVRRRINQEEEPEASRGGGKGDGRSGGGKPASATVSAAVGERNGGNVAAPSSTVPPPSTKPPPSSPLSASSSKMTAVAATARSKNDEDDEGRVPGQALGLDVAHDGNQKAVLISPRSDSFSSETWWMVDLESDPPQGATRLVKTCMHAYGWDPQKARSVLRAYRQFLYLKTKYEDYDAKLLSPSRTVDMMWHQHILDVVNYFHDCALLCGGRVVGHNPRGSEQGPERDERRNATRRALLRHKDEIGIENEEWKELLEDNKTAPPATTVASPAPHAVATPSSEEETYILFVEVPRGLNFTIDVSPDNGRLSDLFDEVVSRTGIPAEELGLFSGGRQLQRDEGTTPRAFGLMNESTILAKRVIQIIVRHQDGDSMIFKVGMDTRMSKIFKSVADKKGVDLEDLRFYLDGDLILYDSTPRMLELENVNIVDVILVQCGC